MEYKAVSRKHEVRGSFKAGCNDAGGAEIFHAK